MTFQTIKCHVCACEFGMPTDFYQVAKRGADKVVFYCPYGHSAVFTKGETEANILRRERDRLIQDAAYKDDRIRELQAQRDLADRRVSAAKGQITKIKKRAAAGLCPCCNRHFTNLERHLGTKHPGYVAEPTADEHVH